MKYKINIHAHSIFSDGINSPLSMAIEAKKLDFTALVITDHFYGLNVPEFMSKNSMRLLKKACHEAQKILPVIIGLEVPFCNQEILVFGGSAINSIIENGIPTPDELIRLKKETGCAVILCHPGNDFEEVAKYVDGFEQYNSGCNYFKNGEEIRPFGALKGRQRWCNSDAHSTEDMSEAYNVVGSKIQTESDIIKYIKKGKQPEFVVNVKVDS